MTQPVLMIFKVTVRFLSNGIQSNSLKIIVHNKNAKVQKKINEVDSK